MPRETQKAKIERLEKEVEELKEKIKESYERENQYYNRMIELENSIENNFKTTSLYKQMERKIDTLKISNHSSENYIKTIEQIRYQQAEKIEEQQNRIEELEKNGIKNNIDTQKENVFKKENSIIFQLSQIKKENLDQIELFNYTFEKFGISLEYQNLIQHDTFNLIINYDTNKIKRGAGRKQKTDINKEKLTLREVEELLKTETAETVSKRLGMSRATFFRRLKKNRELGNLEKRFF